MLGPARTGGAFDPLGCRAVDVYRADDAVALVRELSGQWLFITLTIDRSKFLSPEMAFQRCNERVRRVASSIGPLWFGTIEPQTRTGDGWMHWHLLVHVPRTITTRMLAEFKREVKDRWTFREVVREDIDIETGEVSQVTSTHSIGIVRVEIAGSRSINAGNPEGAARYVAKYIVKGWDAVPSWMGNARGRRPRKFRASPEFYTTLERLHRHSKKIGSRKIPSNRPRRPARTLFERMARSGSACVAFKRDAGAWKFAGVVGVPIHRVTSTVPAYPLRSGHWGKVRYLLSPALLQRLRDHAATPDAARDRDRWVRARHLEFEAMWDHLQDHARRPRDAASEDA